MDSGGRSLAGMSGQPQAVVLGICVDAAEKFRRRLLFVAANSDADNVTIPVARRQLENLLRRFHSEVSRGIENPQQRDPKIARPARTSALQSFEDGGEILLAVQADADSDVHFRVQHGFFFQPPHQVGR